MSTTEAPAKGAPKTQMCVVDIDHLQLLLPAAMGLKLLSLLQKAERVNMDYTRGDTSIKYQRVGNPSLRLEVLRPGQLEDRTAAAPKRASRAPVAEDTTAVGSSMELR